MIPDERWVKSRFYDPRPGQAGKTYSFAAGCIDGVDRFDAAFFGISPREARHIDPQQRLLLELVQEAIEDAGIPAHRLAGREIGVFVGGSSYDYVIRSATDISAMDAYSMQGGALSALSNRVSYIYNLRGPSLTVDTACSSSLVALTLACQAIGRGELEAAVVGGVNMLLTPQPFVGFARASMLSRAGHCHAFDARADGYVRAEGGGAILLKPLSAALADGDEIRAVIRGTASNSDGRTAGLALPSSGAQGRLLREIYEAAEVEAGELGYFEAHGTGTPAGDPIEAEAIGKALGQKRRTRLPIGSVKSNVGHLEAASFMASLMKALVSLRRGEVPRSLHNETPNPKIRFEELNLSLVHRPLALPAGSVIGINSFGFGGTNAHAILAAAPARVVAAEPLAEALPPLLLSARSAAALREQVVNWHGIVQDTPPAMLAPLVRGAARRRDHHPHRLVASAADGEQLAASLDDFLTAVPNPRIVTGDAIDGRLAFVYSGNGSQWVGMGRDAMAGSEAFRAAMARIDSALAPRLGWSVVEALTTADAAALRHSRVAQPLLFAVQVSLAWALAAHGIKASMHLGHSVGEVAAALVSGALSLAQAVEVIVERSARQATTHGDGRMAVLGLSAEAAARAMAAIDPALCVSAINAANSVTVAGPVAAVALLETHAHRQGWSFIRLDLDYAFHSPAMEPIRVGLLEALAQMRSGAPEAMMVSSVTGRMVSAGELDADYWWRNVRAPVLFSAGLATMIESGARIFVEIGPQPVLQHYVRDALRGSSVSGRQTGTLSRNAGGADPVAQIAMRCHTLGATMTAASVFQGASTTRGLPLTAWQRDVFWVDLTNEAVQLISPKIDHPLLGWRESEAAERWQSEISLTATPWLADHGLDGAVVLPAAAMIDIALAAAAARFPAAETLEVLGLEISRAMPLDDQTVRLSSFHADDAGYFNLSSRQRLGTTPALTHAVGRIAAGTSGACTVPSLPPVTEVMLADEVYKRAAVMKLKYGPAFRGMRELYRRGLECSSVTLEPSEQDRLDEGYLIDPAALDSALQAMLSFASPEQQSMTLLPWRFGRVRLLRRGANPASAILRARRHGPRTLAADITLLDADGAAVMELTDCWFVAVREAPRPVADPYYRIAMIPDLRQPAPGEAADPLTVLAGLPEAGPAASVTLTETALGLFLAAADPEGLTPLGRLGGDWCAADFPPLDDGSPDEDVPAPTDLWRAAFYDVPGAAAELVLAARFAEPVVPPEDGAEAEPLMSAMLLEQMLTCSPTARAATAALLSAIDGWLASAPDGRLVRLCVLGFAHPGFARQLLDLLGARGVAYRAVFVAHSAEHEAALGAALAGREGVAVQRERPAAGHFDLVTGFWAHGGIETITPAASAGLLAPGGLALMAEADDGRLVSAARISDVLDGAGITAADVASAWARAGLVVAPTYQVASEVWTACILAAARPVLAGGEDLPSVAGPVFVLGCGDTEMLDWAVPEARMTTREGLLEEVASCRGGDVVVIVPSPELGADKVSAMARMLDDIGRLALVLSGVATRLWLVSATTGEHDPCARALAGLRRVIANECQPLDCRMLHFCGDQDVALMSQCLAGELAVPSAEPEVVFTQAGRFVPRLRTGLLPSGLRQEIDVQLVSRRPGQLTGLGWEPVVPAELADDGVRVSVAAAGMNFRDVMSAMGLLPEEAMMDGFSGLTLGLECAGVVSEVGPAVTDLRPGDRVIAVAPAALASTVVTRRHAVLRVPEGIDLAAAATIPVAFMTVVYSLGMLARIRPGERLLLHGAAGGVGLAAIQYALHRGAVVYATASSRTRRAALLRMGVTAAFDSRSLAFVDDVLAATGGEGVDVVLNSLNGAAMERSLGLLRPFGRFLEIGKRDLYEDTRVGLRTMRHNISYFAIDADELLNRRPAEAGEVMQEIATLLEEGALRPLPYRSFGFDEVEDAFRLMQSSGHVGKIVLTPTPIFRSEPAVTTLRDDGVYVVTGGVSGFGLETARWLADHGVRRLALISRRGAETEGAAEVANGFALAGVDAHVYACDVADRAALAGTLAQIRASAGPIRGVVHAAMVLHDALLAKQDAASFAAVLRPKLAGALALDELTRRDPLEMFLLYSSVTTAIGNPGQANYVAANAALEAIALRRRAEGRPGLAICWGPIGDAGTLARDARVSQMLSEVLGSAHLTAAEALAALPGALAQPEACVGIAAVQWPQLRHHLPAATTALLLEQPARPRRQGNGATLAVQLAELPDDTAQDLLISTIVEELAQILRLPATAIATEGNLLSLGLDSLMAVELRMALEARIGLDLPMLVLTEDVTFKSLAERILDTLRGGKSKGDDVVAMAMRHEGLDAMAPAAGETQKGEAQKEVSP